MTLTNFHRCQFVNDVSHNTPFDPIAIIQTAMLLKLNILFKLNVSFSSYGVLKIEYLNSSTVALGKNERNSMSV